MIYDECEDQWNIDLLTASAVGDEEAVENIMLAKDSHSNLDQALINSRGWTSIMFAAYFGHAALVSLLMGDPVFNVRDKNDKGIILLFPTYFQGRTVISFFRFAPRQSFLFSAKHCNFDPKWLILNPIGFNFAHT